MKIKYKVIDNFLDEDTYNKFSAYLKSEKVPWFFRKVDVPMGNTKNKNGFFSFCFYNHHAPDHDSFHEFMPPFIKQLKARALIQIRANLTFRDIDAIESGFHNDYLYKKSITGIFYLTTCNAKTVLDLPGVNKSVQSVENRMLLFPTNIKHNVLYHTDVHKRYVVNFNFFSEDMGKL
jgi:hypothetical protein